MKTLYAALVAGAFAAAFVAPASAEDQLPLAQKSGCTACHSVDKKIVGPAWKDVAAKYRGDKNAKANLVKKVEQGGSGVWGEIPMPPNQTVSDADVKKLVDWILTLK
ncbi:MAG TPA: c-type cytochrome [Usitatibacter sp.]|nr:c-type cytochrome [Usitatibacter sp.]